MKNPIVIIIVLSIVLLILVYRGRTIRETMANMTGMNAAEACKKISSRAEEIEAHYNGIQGVIQAVQGPFNPRNWSSGDNKTDDMMRNIINTDLSTEERTKIVSECSNSAAGVQSNIIDTSNCPFCQTNRCTISNVKQTNVQELQQTCNLQSMIQVLLTKTNSVDAQALAQTLQKAQGLMSGNNTASSQNCNVVNTDMSSERYLESLSSCSNNLKLDQTNKISFCGDINNVIQENQYKNFQNCLLENNAITQTTMEAQAKVKAESKKEQTTMGLDATASIISAVVSFCSLSIVLFVLVAASGMESDDMPPPSYSRLPITGLPVYR